jgi:hypothetical protein
MLYSNYKKRFFVFLSCILVTIGCLSQIARLPIKAERVISFTTDEGSYMSVDVSPDGKTLLFDLLGDLYTMPVTGGRATQITEGIALNARPCWSPSGEKISYMSDNSGDFLLNILDRNSNTNLVLGHARSAYKIQATSVWLSNDGIAVDSFIYNLSGGRFPFPKSMGMLIRSSPNGNLLYFLKGLSILKYDRIAGTSMIVSPQIVPPSTGIRFPWFITVSNDLNWCAYIGELNKRRTLVIQHLQDSSRRIIGTADMSAVKSFSFSPDCKNLFISYGGKIHRINVEDGSDTVVPFAANVRVGMGKLNYNQFPITDELIKVRYTRSGNLSPDNKQIVFTALNKIYVKDLPDGKPRILVQQDVFQFQPVYSTDGKWIAYVSWNDSVGGYVWRVPATGGKPEQLTSTSGYYVDPTWSPDGKQLAFIKYSSTIIDETSRGTGYLQLISIEKRITRVIDTVPLANKIMFSQSGGEIIYRSLKSKEKPDVLVSMDLNDRIRKVLATGSDRDWNNYPGEISQSPDGKFIVYSLGEDLYLIPDNGIASPAIFTVQNSYTPISVIRFASGTDHYWDNDGAFLNWTYGNKFYRIKAEKIIESATKVFQQKSTSDTSFQKYLDISVAADQVIQLNVEVPRYSGKGSTVLDNVRIITMQGNKIIGKGRIVIKNNHLVAVGPQTAIQTPAGAHVMDLSGCTIMPGFIDMHFHASKLDIYPQPSFADFKINLAFGITTLRDPSSDYRSFGHSELLETGIALGPRLYSSGLAVVKTWFNGTRCNSLNDAKNIADKRKESGGTFIKQYKQPTRLQRQWLLQACCEAKLNMTNEGDDDPLVQIGMIKDGSTGIEHSPVWGPVYNDVISLFANSGTIHTPTLQTRDQATEYFLSRYWQQRNEKLERFNPSILSNSKNTGSVNFLFPAGIYAAIVKKGGKVAMGSHSEVQGISVHNEIWALQMGGLTNMQALQAATIIGAEGLGVQKDLGSIEVGKIADLIILNKNPLDDIHNTREIRYVMKNGVLYDGDTLEQIWPIIKKNK